MYNVVKLTALTRWNWKKSDILQKRELGNIGQTSDGNAELTY